MCSSEGCGLAGYLEIGDFGSKSLAIKSFANYESI